MNLVTGLENRNDGSTMKIIFIRSAFVKENSSFFRELPNEPYFPIFHKNNYQINKQKSAEESAL